MMTRTIGKWVVEVFRLQEGWAWRAEDTDGNVLPPADVFRTCKAALADAVAFLNEQH